MVSFEPFSGFSHQRLSDLFSWVPRKADDVRRRSGQPIRLDGRAVIWRAHEASVRPSIFNPDFGETENLMRLLTEMRILTALPAERPRATCASLAEVDNLLSVLGAALSEEARFGADEQRRYRALTGRPAVTP
jgi:cytidine deaminase